MKVELVSIVMPVYNAGLYLKACLDSILDQSYSNWELIAVDDYSTDSSYKILLDYQDRDDRITVLKNASKGIIDALKLGYNHSSGQWITRMDADDVMATNKLQVLQLSISNAPQNSVAVGKVQYFSEGTLGQGYTRYAEWLNRLSDQNQHWSEVYRECVIPSPSWMMRKTEFVNIGGFNSASYPEDYDLCFRMYKRKLNLVSTDQIVHYWRDHPERASRNDPNYEDNRFLEMKFRYFMELDYRESKELILWGAGRKGKILAKKLISLKVPFRWMTNNASKIGLHIYGQQILSDSEMEHIVNPQFIIAIAAPDEVQLINQRLKKKQYTAGKEYFYFC